MALVRITNLVASKLFVPVIGRSIPSRGTISVSMDPMQRESPDISDMISRGLIAVSVAQDPAIADVLEAGTAMAQASGDGAFGTLTTTVPVAATGLTVPVADESVVQVTAKILGRQAGGPAACAYTLVGLFQRDGGTLAQVGATTVASTIETDAGLNAVFAVSGSNVVVNVTGLGTSGVAATGSVTTPAGSLLLDGETFVLNDGVNPAVTFEFDDDASVVQTATLRGITFVGTETAADMKTLIVAAIAAAKTAGSLAITASPGAAGLVNLANDATGIAGNVVITDTVADVGFIPAGMSGGVTEIPVSIGWRLGAEVFSL